MGDLQLVLAGGIDEGDDGVDVPPAMQQGSAAAAAAPAPRRTPLRRSLLDDAPRGVLDRGEVMRRRLGQTGSASSAQGFERQASASASEPAPEPARPLLEAWNRSGTAGSGVNVLQRRTGSVAIEQVARWIL